LTKSEISKIEFSVTHKYFVFYSESLFLIFVLAILLLYLFFILIREKKLSVAREEFLALAAHELKQPVSSLRMLLQSLQKEQEGKLEFKKKQKEKLLNRGYLETITLSQQIEKLLIMQKIESLPKRESPYCFAEMLDAKIKTLLESRKTLASRLFVQIHSFSYTNINREMMWLILTNLIDNAAKYSDGKILLELHEKDKHFILTIKDEGIGMSKEELAEATKLFFRSKRHEVQNKVGTGLGLYLVSRICHLLKIDFALESQGMDKGLTCILSWNVYKKIHKRQSHED
ncbi:MAG: sensor histidine kinase, partial [Candidatus Hydrogenedentota bacterium]